MSLLLSLEPVAFAAVQRDIALSDRRSFGHSLTTGSDNRRTAMRSSALTIKLNRRVHMKNLSSTSDVSAVRESLTSDFQSLVSHAEELLHATTSLSNEGVDMARQKLNDSLRQVKAQIGPVRDAAFERGKIAIDTAVDVCTRQVLADRGDRVPRRADHRLHRQPRSSKK
jgi:ElaB/YqjD/DUF883 family membrane-anchored ribosome-binding protein